MQTYVWCCWAPMAIGRIPSVSAASYAVLRDFLARFYSGSSDRLDYFCSFIVSGNLTLTLEWLSGGAKETPEEMAALAGAIIMDGVRTL